MIKVLTKILCCVVCIVFSPLSMSAQGQHILHSGDMNNNGIVNAVDILYWGQTYGESGPERGGQGSVFLPQSLDDLDKFDQLYEDSLYNIDIAYADANGDGRINDLDIDQALIPNYGLTHGTVLPEGYRNGVPNVDPAVVLTSNASSVIAGESVDISIDLGDSNLPAEDFYGIAFQLSFENDLVESSAPFTLKEDGNGWTNTIGSDTRQFIFKDQATGKAEYVITKTDKLGIDLTGANVGVISIVIDDIIILPKDTLTIQIDSVRMIDAQFRTHAVAIDSATIDIVIDDIDRSSGNGCPDEFDPVCATDGYTYYNSCYAELAGVTVYTTGVCTGDCINPEAISNDDSCADNSLSPVCGCNGQTYINACHADAAGVITYTSGACNPDNDCIDYGAIINTEQVKPDDNGVLLNKCTDIDEPVCGCNGVTYLNSCYAEISGVSSYTPGSCDDSCIDPTLINPLATCVATYDPVCGCNDITYNNACFAEAAGVQNYVAGTCGSSNGGNGGGNGGTPPVVSNWCSDAQTVYCGDLLLNQTTVGSDNDFSSYTVLPNYTLLGPDKVYNLNKTTTGDLQISLEITTPNLDLDLFLLSGDCGNYTAIAQSSSNNQLTNLESIIVEDAPLGNYYIVVDGQFPASQGNFRLDISCGYLDCSNAIDLTCGQPQSYTNAYGEDNISVYNCDGLNEYSNSGPEVVHTVTTTSTGQLDVTLSNLNANLNMYLLNACDHTQCIESSTNAGTWNEHISAYVPAGTYYIVVDGYNGATSSYNIAVNCAQTCDVEVNATATYSSCGQNTGTITVSSTGGTPGYIVSYNGPLSGSFYTAYSTCTISNLPPGTYTVTKTDANGCSDYAVVTINDGSNLNFSTWVTDAICGMGGAVEVTFTNGAAPYTVIVTGPKNVQVTTYNNTVTIPDLLDGMYIIQVLDSYGCSSSQTVTVEDSNSGFTYTATGNPAYCGQLGSISVNIPYPASTQAPFNIQLSGPVSGFDSTNSSSFNIINLPGGTYNLTIENEYWCQETQVVVIENYYMTIGTTVNNGICGQDGSIDVTISDGSPTYEIEWSGQESGSTWVSNPNYTINNLSTGTYTVSVTDANGCTDYEVVQIDNSNSHLNTAAIGITGSCGFGSIWLDIFNGNAPYSVSWSGPSYGQGTTSNDGYDIQDIPAGIYTVIVTDANGCISTSQVTVESNGTDINLNLQGNAGACGVNGSIWVGITNGSAPYTIAWDGPSSGATTSSNGNYDITNLPAGNYTVTATDANGCSVTDTVYISNSTSSNIVINTTTMNSVCGENGSIWGTITGGSPNYTVTWTGPTSGSTTTNGVSLDIDGLEDGTYTLVVTDSNGCTATETVYIFDSVATIDVTASAIHASCNTTGSIWLGFSGGSAPYTIDWSGASSGTASTSNSNFDIQNLGAGSYTVVVTDSNGCSDTVYISITGGNGGLNVTPSTIDCVCGQNGSIWLSIADGDAPYTVAWNGQGISNSATTSSSNFDIQNLPCGTYAVTVTDDNGCQETFNTTINQGAASLSLSLWGTNAVCNGFGAIETTLTGGTAPYTISWTGTTTGSMSTSNTAYIISNLPEGTYNVIAADANGCTATETISIHEVNDLNLSLWGTDGTCGSNGAIEVTITGGTAGYDIIWSGASSGNASTANGAYIISNLPAGNYKVDIIDANGCVSTKDITIGSSSNVDVSLVGTNGVCGSKGSIEVTITGGTSAYTVEWSGASSGTATIVNNTYVISNLPQGPYSVKVTDANGCNSTESITIIQTNDLGISLWNTDAVCNGYGAIEVTIAGGASPYSVAWSGTTSGSASTASNAYIIGSLPAGNYTVTVSDANGCVSTEAITVNNSGNNLGLTATPNDGVCGAYGSIDLVITGGTSAYDVTWSGASSGSANTMSGTYTINNLPQGTYTINVTDANGCTTTKTVTVNQTNGLSVSLWGTDAVCNGTGAIEVTVTGGAADYTIDWSGASTGTATTSNGTYVITSLTPGNYTVQVTDNNGCVSTETISIYDITNDLAITATSTNGTCGTYGSIWVNMSGGQTDYTLTWSGAVSGSVTTASTSYDITNLPSGTYLLTLTDANGCSVTKMVNVSNGNNSLAVSVSAVDGTCGTLGSIWIDFTSGIPNYLVSWTGASSGSATTSASAYTIPNLTAGTYNVAITDSNGCTYNETLTVQVDNGNFQLVATGNNGACGANGSIDLTMTGGLADYMISWSGPVTGSTTQSGSTYTIPNLPTGAYNVNVVDANGCGQAQSVSVYSSNGNLSVSTVSYPAYCNQANSGSIWLDITGGTAPYSVAWTGTSAGNATTQDNFYEILDLNAGSYTIVITDANGCMDTEVVTVNSTAGSISINPTATGVSCGSAGTIDLDISGTTTNFSIMWSGPTNGTVFTTNTNYQIGNTVAGTYTIIVTDTNGCSATETVVVNSSGGGNIGLVVEATDVYCNIPGSLWITITNGTPTYTIEWSGPVSGTDTAGSNTYDIPNTPAGTYTITVTDSNGCSSTETITVIENSSSLMVNASPTNAACGVSGSIWLNMSGGSAPYDIQWSGTSTGSATSNNASYDINNLNAGTYYVTVTDANGCSVTETVTVGNGGSSLVTSANPTNMSCGTLGSIYVTISSGSAAYTIDWTGPTSGTATTSNAAYSIPDLGMGAYTVVVTDATGCSNTEMVTIAGSNALSATITGQNGSCNGGGSSIDITMINGAPNYTVTWSGAEMGSALVTGNTYTIDNLSSGTYNVLVEDSNGCTFTKDIQITSTGGYPVADFSYTTNVLTLTTTNNTSAGTTYSWDFGDGNTSTETNPVYAFCEEGTFNVCLTATNACGTDIYCEMVTVSIPSNVCTLDVGEVGAAPGATVYVPVTISNCNLIVSLAGSLDIVDNTVGDIIGLSPGVIAPQFNGTDLTFNYYDNNGQGIPVSDGDILFYLVVQAGNTAAGLSTNIMITNSPLQIEVGTIINGMVTTVNHVALKGSLTIESSANISGQVSTYWGEGIEDTEVRFINNNGMAVEMTDENGDYMHPDIPMNEMYEISPQRDFNDANGLSTFALFVGQRFILGMDPIEITSPYQIIAGDANCNGSFTTLDLFLIQQIIIGTNNEFNDCPAWVFVKEGQSMPTDFNAYNVFPYENSETMMITEDALVDFVGVKVGDILGHANPHNFGGIAEDRDDDDLVLKVAKQSYEAGETVELNFRSDNFADIVSYQLGLKFDHNKLTFVDAEDGSHPNLSSTAIGTTGVEKGDLRVSWFSTNGSGLDVANNEQLFTLRFTANEAIANIEDLLNVNSDQILSEAHNGSLDRMNVVIEFEEATTTSINTIEIEGYELAQNTPNPFVDQTTITFELPTAMPAQIIVHNQLGEAVHVIDNDFNQGQNTIIVSQKEIGTGVFYYTLKTKEFTTSRSMISIK